MGLSSSQEFHREAEGYGRFLTDWEEKSGGAAGIWGLQMYSRTHHLGAGPGYCRGWAEGGLPVI